MQRILITAAAVCFLAACGDGSTEQPDTTPDDTATPQPDPITPASFDVAATNLTLGQPLSPLAVLIHDSGQSVLRIGEAASAGLELLAEGGDNSELLAEIEAVAEASGGAPVGPGSSETLTLELPDDQTDGLSLSVVSMLVNTNDAITGLHGISLAGMAVGDSMTYSAVAYDAGTEANSELAGTIPGPADGGEGFNEMRDDVGDFVTMHPGVVTADDGLTLSVLNQMHRFDNPGPVLAAAFNQVFYPETPLSTLPTVSTVKALERKTCATFHRSFIASSALVLAISGDFRQPYLDQRIESLFPKTPLLRPNKEVFPQPSPSAAPGVLFVHKPISQSWIRVARSGVQRPHPDYYPLSLLNFVFGGGSFTSRLSSTIRSDNGLTYSIYSSAESNYVYPGTIYVHFHTKTENTFRAIELVEREMEKIQKDGVTDRECAQAKKVMVDGLPSMFRNSDDLVQNYAWSTYYGRQDDHYRVYPEKIDRIQSGELNTMAEKYLSSDSLVYIIVGDTTQLFNDTLCAQFRSEHPSRVILPRQLLTP